MNEHNALSTPRRGFLARLATGTLAALAGGQAASRAQSLSRARAVSETTEPWLQRIKGKHKQVFDAMEIKNGEPLLMTRGWFMAHDTAYKLSPSELTAVLVLRHNAIGLCLKDEIWERYRLGEFFKVNDPTTGKPATRNLFATSKSFPVPQFSIAALESLNSLGVVLCGCRLALTILSGEAAEKANLPKEAAAKEWEAGLIPGVTLVASGTLAVGRAQEHGCTYCNVT